jgi:hypothetical protein
MSLALSGIMGLTVSDVPVVALPARVVFFIARMNKSFMSDEEVTSCKCLGTDVANEGLLFGMGTDVSLEMFLGRTSA